MFRVVVIFLGLSVAASASAFRCGDQLIVIEATYMKTHDACGEPMAKENYSKQYCHHSEVNGLVNKDCSSITVDILTYKRNGMTHTLTFKDKVLKSINSCRVC